MLVRLVSAAMATLSRKVAERATRLAHASNSFFSVVVVVRLCVYIFQIVLPCLNPWI